MVKFHFPLLIYWTIFLAEQKKFFYSKFMFQEGVFGQEYAFGKGKIKKYFSYHI